MAAVESPGRVALLNLNDPLSAEPLILLDTAAEIWRLIPDADEPAVTIADLVSAASEAFSMPPDQIGDDVRNFVEQLDGAGLVSVRTA